MSLLNNSYAIVIGIKYEFDKLDTTQDAKDTVGAGVIKPGAVGNDTCFHFGIYVFEMHVAYAIQIAPHECHWVKACIRMVPRVKADL